MGIFNPFKQSPEEKAAERAWMQGEIMAQRLVEDQRIRTTCKSCQKIFSEGYPYQRTMFGKVKSYVCGDCAKKMGLK